MGLDMYIDARRNIGTPQEEREEVMYWRKFWDLQNYIVEITDAKVESAEGKVCDTKLTKEDLENIIHFCCYNRDYFDGFTSVPKLCNLWQKWEWYAAEGWTFWYNGDW